MVNAYTEVSLYLSRKILYYKYCKRTKLIGSIYLMFKKKLLRVKTTDIYTDHKYILAFKKEARCLSFDTSLTLKVPV